jgi:heme/copper-type cytochrome/quinol oxidase subunit 1
LVTTVLGAPAALSGMAMVGFIAIGRRSSAGAEHVSGRHDRQIRNVLPAVGAALLMIGVVAVVAAMVWSGHR